VFADSRSRSHFGQNDRRNVPGRECPCEGRKKLRPWASLDAGKTCRESCEDQGVQKTQRKGLLGPHVLHLRDFLHDAETKSQSQIKFRRHVLNGSQLYKWCLTGSHESASIGRVESTGLRSNEQFLQPGATNPGRHGRPTSRGVWFLPEQKWIEFDRGVQLGPVRFRTSTQGQTRGTPPQNNSPASWPGYGPWCCPAKTRRQGRAHQLRGCAPRWGALPGRESSPKNAKATSRDGRDPRPGRAQSSIGTVTMPRAFAGRM